MYLTSSGFDASILHDDDGKKYIVSLEWETREGYEKPGVICCVEYDPETKHVVGYPKRIWRGATDRGCIEAPHLTKRDGWYYIMCAEGGTGYNHAVSMGRSCNGGGHMSRISTVRLSPHSPRNPTSVPMTIISSRAISTRIPYCRSPSMARMLTCRTAKPIWCI